jgi:hypothetical protein
MTTAFQSNAFQNDAFQIDAGGGDPPFIPGVPTTIGSGGRYPAVPGLLLRKKQLEKDILELVEVISAIAELSTLSDEALRLIAARMFKRGYSPGDALIPAVIEAIQELSDDWIDLYDDLPEPFKPTPITFERPDHKAIAWANLKAKATGTLH